MYLVSWAGKGDMYYLLRYTTRGYVRCTARLRMALSMSMLYIMCYSAAQHGATSGRWASRRAADGRTPRQAADRWAFRRALHYGWAYMLTLWGKEDTEGEAVPWKLGNIKFQVG